LLKSLAIVISFFLDLYIFPLLGGEELVFGIISKAVPAVGRIAALRSQ